MTLTATSTGAKVTHDQARILAHYAAGESAKDITINTKFDMATVGHVLDALAGNDRARAHGLVLEYQSRAQAVAAARGVSAAPTTGPATVAAARPVPAPPQPAPATAAAADPAPVPTAGTPGRLLDAAEATGVARLTRAAVKIRALLADLHDDLAAHTLQARLRAEQADLEARLAQVKEQLRPAAKRSQPGTTPVDEHPVDTKAMRAWAAEQGLDCPARGRVPASITAAYRQAVTR